MSSEDHLELPRKYAFLFPGQGSQYVGMGKALAEQFDIAAQALAEADRILGYPLSRLCFQGPEDALNDTANTQPAILAVSIAAWRVLEATILPSLLPAALAGHSLGEFSGLVVAGSITFADALRLVRRRGILARDASGKAVGGMLAIMAKDLSDIEDVMELVRVETGSIVELANDNCPGQVVLGGHREALHRVQEIYASKGALCNMLKVSAPLHTSLMQSMSDAFRAILDQVAIKSPTIPVIGNVEAMWLRSPDDIRQELSNQLTHTVHWTDSMRRLVSDMEVEAVIEIGPGKVLTSLMRRINRSIKRVSFGNKPAELDKVIALLRE